VFDKVSVLFYIKILINIEEEQLLRAVEDISSTKKRLRIEIPSDIIEKEIKDSLERVRQNTNFPGFRPGKTPISLVEKRFGKKVEAEVLEKIIPEFYGRALKEADLKPVTIPVLDEEIDFKRNSPINLSLTVEVMPKIEKLEYSDIQTKEIAVNVDETEVEDSLKKLQQEKAIYEVAEKEIGKDDLVTFDYVDCEILGEKNTSPIKEQVLKMGKEILPMDIERELIGKKKGEIIELSTTVDEKFRLKELAGKTVKIKVIIKEIKQKTLPVIDDEFAKDMGFENISKLKEKIKENMYIVKKERATKIQKAEILRKIIETHNFEIPETMLKNELESLITQEKMSGAKDKMENLSGVHHALEILNPQSELIKQEEEKSKEDISSQLKERALRNVKAAIIIDAIGKKEGVAVTENELKDRIHLTAERLSAKPEAIMNFYMLKDGSLEGLKHSIYEEKVLDILLAKAFSKKGE
jgi:trigger factor